MPLGPASRLGPYEILASIGAGGMGEVYKARDTRLNRAVALKVLPDLFANDHDRLTRFAREAQTLALLNHTNIAQIHGLEESDGVRALVMELVEGEDLSTRIARGPIPLDEALPILKQIADALLAAHAQGVVHRDLKPANVKIRSDGVVKVLDFGLAKALEPSVPAPDLSQSPTLTATRAGLILGTAKYMSPEQARGRSVDQRTDIWAFGCVAYEMLSDRPAFSGDTVTDILSGIVTRDPDWSRLPPRIPVPIQRLLRRCLVKDVNDRLHSIADARLELADARNEPAVISALARPSRTMGIVATIAVIAALAMVVPTIRSLRPAPDTATPDAPETRLQVITPPTTDPISMAISPDGRRLTFVASNDGAPRLWLRPLDGVTAQPLPGTDGASYPFWSPDSRSIGFFAEGKLKRIDLGGGPPQILASIAGARGGTWNREGDILLGGYAFLGLMRVRSSGGEIVRATRAQPGAIARFPQFLPDGKHFLFFSQGAGDAQGIFLGVLDSPDTTRVTSAETAAAYVPTGHLFFVRQGSLVARPFDPSKKALTGEPVTVADPVGWDGAIGVGAFSASATGVIAYRSGGPVNRQLTWFDRTGKPVGVVDAPDASSLQYPQLSRDGHRLVVDRTVLNNRDVFVVDLATGQPTRLTFDSAVDAAPVWSPDGARIVFRSSRNGNYDLYERSASFDGAENLLYGSPDAKTPNDWSPDGKSLLYVSQNPTTGNDLFVLPVDNGSPGKPVPFVQTPFDESQASFSPNGQWVAYQSDESGPMQVYVQPFPGSSGKRQISNAGGASPRWSRDGRELYYTAPDATLMAVPIVLRPSSLDTGTPKALFKTRLTTAFGGTAGNIRPQYDVAPDGRFLMNITTEETISPITIILNWKPPAK
jgi:serine/threonine protein kinase